MQQQHCPFANSTEVNTVESLSDTTDSLFFPIRTQKKWPSPWNWVKYSRADAISLFPDAAYQQPREDYRVFRQSLVTVCDPASIKLICGKHAKKYGLTNLHKRMLAPSLGEGLIVAEGDLWKQQRRVSLQQSHPKAFSFHLQLAEQRIDTLLKHWATMDGKSCAILDDLCATSIDLIAHTFFGYQQTIATKSVLDLIARHRKIVEHVDLFDVMGLSPTLRSRKMRRAYTVAHELDDEILSTISAWKQEQAQASADIAYNERDFVVSILSGFESVAVTCNWALAILSQRPDLIERIRAEPLHDPVNIATQPCALQKVLFEVLRLFPPLPLIYRHALQDDVLPVGSIKKGSIVCISPWLLHRHQAHWEKPNHFSLDRWETGATFEAFMPFGIGARQCIGMRLGLSLCALMIKRVVARYDVRLAHTAIPSSRAGVSLRPVTPIHFNLLPVG